MQCRPPMKAKQTYRKNDTDKKTVEEQKCAHTNLFIAKQSFRMLDLLQHLQFLSAVWYISENLQK